MAATSASRGARDRNVVIRELGDGTFADMESTHATLGEAQRNLVFGEPAMSPREMACIVEAYVASSGFGAVPAVEQLKKLREILVEATTLARTGQAMRLTDVSRVLPAAMVKYLNSDDVAVWSEETEFHSHLFEVMSTLVELTVVMLSDQVEFPVEIPSNQSMNLCNVTLKLLEALCAVFDSRSQYYKLRGEKDTRRDAFVCWWRLESALQAPGFFVKVSGVVNDQAHYFCAEKGVNHIGEACECCRPPSEADAVLVNLSWRLAKTTSGNGYEYMLRFLVPPRQISLVTAELLLRPFVQLLGICKAGSTTWKMLIQHVEDNSTADFQRLCVNVCSGMSKYVESILFWSYFKTVYGNNMTISDAVGHLETITSWIIFHYGRVTGLELVRESLCKLQKKLWEMLLDAKRFSMACASMLAAMEANSFLTDSGDATLDLSWMEQENVISRILKPPVEMGSASKVIQFVTMIGKKGLVLPEEEFFEIVIARLQSSTFDPTVVNPEDQKLAAMLDCLDLSGYSNRFLDAALEWLELERQRASGMDGAKVISTLSKLLVCDKDKRLEKKFLKLLCKQAANIRDRDLVFYVVSKIADHYTSEEASEHLKKSATTSEEQEKLVQYCSDNMNNDSKCFISSLTGALNATEAYGQKTNSWKEKEINLQVNSSPKLSNVLESKFPFICPQTGKECLDRVVSAQRLVGNLNTDGSNTFESSMTSAMSIEFRTLEALQKETLLHSQLLRQAEELSEKHLQAYDDMKQEQHDKIVKFLQTCQQEKESAVGEALYEKEKFMSSVRKAGISTDGGLPFEDIPTRLLRAAGGALQQVEGRHKESLERLPNSDCVVCFLEFSSKRKRACLDPCGHASACFKCATREWKRTRTCPMCKSDIEKPVSAPFKLYF